jgi:serine/threonine-protein kinase
MSDGTSAARTDSAVERKPGDVIAKKLELVRRLAEGGMGALWVARNLSTHAEVAIKVLLPHRSDDDHAAERFRHEAEVGAKLAHRNVTRVFDLLVDDDGSLVLVMELLHGRTLEAAYKEKGTLPAAEAVELIVPILGALQHAHDRGVIHRDVKPSNIFLDVDPDGHTTPKLLDFGIAKETDSTALTQTGEALGSPKYMSPEQVRASKQLDGKSDLFSIGVVLYEVITGENPFDAPSPTAALAQVLELEVDPDPRIEPRLWLEIQRALSKQPYERHGSARELAEALSRAVGLSTSSPPPSSRSAPPRSEARRAATPEPRTEKRPVVRDVAHTAVMPFPPPPSARDREAVASAFGAVPSTIPGAMPSTIPSAMPGAIPAVGPSRTRLVAAIAAAVGLMLLLGFVIFGRSSKPDGAASTSSAQPEGGPAIGSAGIANGNANANGETANGDAPPSGTSVGDLDTPPTAAPHATRGVPRRRQLALPAATRSSPGSSGGVKPSAPATSSGPSIARTPGF